MNIIKNSHIWFAVSSALIVFSVAVLGIEKISSGNFLKYGIDFTGGALMEIELEDKEKTSQDLMQVFNEYEDLTPMIQNTEDKTFIIKMKSLSNEEHQNILDSIEKQLGIFEENRFITIGPAIGESLKKKSMIALVLTLIAIVVYIAFAFREMQKKLSAWKFGISAIIALTHDTIITIGIFSFICFFNNAEIDSLFITALLTIMGFSVHDTIVTFDRVRENFKFARPTEKFGDISEKAIKQTITRSINTSLSTLFPLVALYFLGSDSIRMFILTLIIGIIIGTYSSIFLATPVLVKWEGIKQKV